MAQKINPISFRLGIVQLWNTNIQIYGKSYKFYFYIFHKYLQIYKYLTKLFYLYGFIINSQEWKLEKNKIKLHIFYSKIFFQTEVKDIIVIKKIFSLIKKFLFYKIELFLYFNLSLLSINLFVAYTQNLIDENVSSKKIIWTLSKILESYLNSKKIIYHKNGILKLKLKGFKIQLSGRLDNSKTQMAKKYEYVSGYLPLTYIKSHIVYSSNELYTKSGICGIKLWLFYEFY
uniref:ribosomal protein S3 n=1 Tax=Cystoclonium purpureum f. stellatum TaxID=3024809 RepID=UPI0023F4862F|nr:ribosomal protein S3 [Cystoclonium purpureum f. stellatum]WDY85175.1 ribosomal protein S3 [Cystoclonium purpureum f. stellatum]